MTESRADELDEDLAALLHTEKHAPPEPAGRRATMRAALERRIHLASPGSSDGSYGDGGAEGAAVSATATSGAAITAWIGLGVALGLSAGIPVGISLAPKGADEVAAPTAIDETNGARIDQTEPAGEASSAEASVGTPVAPRPASEQPTEAASARSHSVVQEDRRARRPRPPETRPAAPSTLAAERELMQVAHAAVSRRNGVDALTAIEEHETRFPQGQLTEERESLRVQALSQLGRMQEARERAARFGERYPNSLLRGVVESAARER